MEMSPIIFYYQNLEYVIYVDQSWNRAEIFVCMGFHNFMSLFRSILRSGHPDEYPCYLAWCYCRGNKGR
jgi:hypothetical protein